MRMDGEVCSGAEAATAEQYKLDARNRADGPYPIFYGKTGVSFGAGRSGSGGARTNVAGGEGMAAERLAGKRRGPRCGRGGAGWLEGGGLWPQWDGNRGRGGWGPMGCNGGDLRGRQARGAKG